jgi:hypothetical protein
MFLEASDCFGSLGRTVSGHPKVIKGHLRAVSGHSGPGKCQGSFWALFGKERIVSDCFRPFSASKAPGKCCLGPFQTIQAISAYFESRRGSFGPARSRCRPFKTVLGCFRWIRSSLDDFKTFPAISGWFGPFGSIWDHIADHFAPFWTILGLLVPIRTIFSHRVILSHVGPFTDHF